MRGFRVERGAFVAELDATERAAVAAVVADVVDLLGVERPDGASADADRTEVDRADDGAPLSALWVRSDDIEAPRDAALHRLLPDASRDDPAVTAEFRRLTEDDLRRTKSERLVTLWHLLASDPADGWPAAALVVLPAIAAGVAATLTDVRLVLAERLGLSDDESSDALYNELESDEPQPEVLDARTAVRQYLGSVYVALSWLQESLVAAMLDELDRR